MTRARRIEVVPIVGRLERGAAEQFELRWHDLDRFPYSLHVGVVEGERYVVAVAHQMRQPGYWKKRLAKMR